MSTQLVAQRYTRALVASVEDDAQLDGVLASLVDFSATYAEHGELRRALENPSIAYKIREQLFGEIIDRLEGPVVARNFLMTLFQRGRIAEIESVVSTLGHVVDGRLKRAHAHVTVASELDPEQRRKVESGLENYTKKSIQMETHVDPEILGGVVVRMDGTVIDGSLRSRLGRIREALLNEEIE